MRAGVRAQYDSLRFATFDAMPAKDCDLDDGMPVRGEGHHAFFDGQGKVDNLHNYLQCGTLSLTNQRAKAALSAGKWREVDVEPT